MNRRIAVLVLAAAVVLLGCGGAKKAETAPSTGAETGTLRIGSPAFADGAAIPQKFSQFGEGVSPALEWSGAPEGTQTFALVCRDPDAPMGTFVHWVIYEITDSAKGLPEGVPNEPMVQTGGIQGTNSARTFGYVGPRPPAGPAHRYIFTLYALDQQLGLGPGISEQELIEQIRDRILDSAKVTGTFRRPE
jgi:Raf kinase inhibitor-like YbhB/YbcL family protein